MASVNKVILLGRLGHDPELRFTANGEAMCNFRIATTDTWKDHAGVEQERVEWHNIVLYRRLAEIAGEYLKQGRTVYIEGRLQTNKWQNKEGNDHYKTEIVVSQMQMLGRLGAAQDSNPPDNLDANKGYSPFGDKPTQVADSINSVNPDDEPPF
jgi:single-strand DNA-binding protein